MWRSAITANDVGPFFKQPIDHRTLSTQLYIVVTALTTLFLAAVVSERERVAQAARRGQARARASRRCEERHRIARDLHDSVSQSLFSTLLAHPHGQKALGAGGVTTTKARAGRWRRSAS